MRARACARVLRAAVSAHSERAHAHGTSWSARNDDFKEDEPEMDGGTPPREGEDKYQAMVLTPGGSIIAIGDPNKERKPETDPDWEERKAQWDAERKRAAKGKKRSRQPDLYM